MNSVRKLDLISPASYLAQELQSTTKHEYLGGVVYAMSGASNRHNRIATNVTVALGSQLRGRSCEAFNSDTKVRIILPAHTRFYYPDAMVVCRSNPEGDTYQDTPALIVEVLSPRTRRTDEGEKKEAYLSVPSLHYYLLVEQEEAAVVAYRRTDQGFVRSVYQGLQDSIVLPELDLEFSLAEIYARVRFGPEPDEEEPES